MAVRDIVSLLSPWLDYPGVPSKAHPDGHTYRVPSPDRQSGLRMTALASLGQKAALGQQLTEQEISQLQIDGDKIQGFIEMTLGDVAAQMAVDGVANMTVQSIARDAFYCFTANEELADVVLQGEAKARDAALKKAGTGPKTAGSRSSKASSATRARTRNPASSRSSATPARTRARKTA